MKSPKNVRISEETCRIFTKSTNKLHNAVLNLNYGSWSDNGHPWYNCFDREGGMMVDENRWKSFTELEKKVAQQEQTIAQLVAIIAVTNRKISKLAEQQKKQERKFQLIAH